MADTYPIGGVYLKAASDVAAPSAYSDIFSAMSFTSTFADVTVEDTHVPFADNFEPMSFASTFANITETYSGAADYSAIAALTFDDGTAGQLANGADGFDEALSNTKYSTAQAYTGTQSAIMQCTAGHNGDPSWGGKINVSPKMVKDEEIWVRFRSYMPAAFDYTTGTDPNLKFLRVHVETAGGGNVGYNDMYIGTNGKFNYIFEGQGTWTFGSSGVAKITHDIWDTYEFNVYFDNASVDSGGGGRFRWWKNGVLVSENTNSRTLNNSTDKVDIIHLFTHWNYGAPMNLTGVTGGSWTPGNKARGQTSGRSMTIATVQDSDTLLTFTPITSDKSWQDGETIEELSGGTPTGVEGTLVSRYQTCYLDDIIVTKETPSETDAGGNPMIGTTAVAGDF